MSNASKIVKRIEKFYQQYIVKGQYPMLTSFSRNSLKRDEAIGLVYMLHHICEKDHRRIPTNEDLKVSPIFLEKIILAYKKNGFEFISLDQLYNIISDGEPPSRPIVLFTIDDGYLDNYTKALPVFERYDVPFAVFVATDFIDKKAILWWDCLEELILTHDSVITDDGMNYSCRSYQQRWDTFRILRERVLNLDQGNLESELNKMFSTYSIDWYAPIKQQGMSWEQVKILANHPLCTIGGHTVSHLALSKLSAENARKEIFQGLKKIEDAVQHEIKYFAYPYGTPNEVGIRELKIVEDINIRLSFMAHQGCLTVGNIKDVSHLPRVYLRETSHI